MTIGPFFRFWKGTLLAPGSRWCAVAARVWPAFSTLIIASLLVAGCGLDNFFASEPEVPLELDYNRVLPEGWRPIEQWHEVNIDGDADTEYLLLFTYDSGQVGAVIYDQQVSTDLVGSTLPDPVAGEEGGPRLPLQAFGYYRPYLLLPSNWDFTYGGAVSHGFIAHPQDAGNVVVSTAVRGQNNFASMLGMDDVPEDEVIHPAAELVIQGGTTHLTFVWWKNRQEGYGVTQLYAPGGFRGINWADWRATPQPIDRISGLFPLADYRARSLLCRETEYRRVGIGIENGAATGAVDGESENLVSPIDSLEPSPTLEAEDRGDGAAGAADAPPVLPENGVDADTESADESQTPSIAFASQDLGVRFCTPSLPPHPFYPEGVTMAYLVHAMESDGNAAQDPARERLVTAGVGTGLLDETLNVQTLGAERVNDIQSFATVPVSSEAVHNGVFVPTTSVCVELAQLENPNQRRWLLFTLRYHAPDMEARTPDRWTISGISEQPPPVDAGASMQESGEVGAHNGGYCQVILGLDASTQATP